MSRKYCSLNNFRLISKLSPSGKYRAVIRECETKDGLKQFLEIWEQLILTHCVDLNAADEHSDVYTDGQYYACLNVFAKL